MAEIITNEYFANHIDLFKENFSKIKIIALDLDGTLLNNNFDLEVGTEINQMCKILYNKYKVNTLIATGRTLLGSMTVKNTLISKINVPLILYNGSVIVHNNTYNIMKQKFIDFGSVNKILNILKEYKKVKITCNRDWELLAFPKWVIVSRNNYDEIVVESTKNNTSQKRIGEIEVGCLGEVKKITILQK